jgi:hypothetical protein
LEKIETCTDELTKDIVTEGKNINNVVKIFNASIVKGATKVYPGVCERTINQRDAENT